MSRRPAASVIVVVHSAVERLDDALASLAGYQDRSDVEVVLVDNGSADEVGREARRRHPRATVVRSDVNLGFAGGVRLGVEAAAGEVLVLLNDDAAAGPGFVEAHLEALAGCPGAAASAGHLTSWDGRRHDFARGAVTFDAHALQLGQGRPITALSPPGSGEPLPFACGGNMAVRRRDWELVGGFDESLFAYFEDVELGWRLWAAGREVVAAPAAVARHRGSATSAGLGDFRRGVLFERNALRVFFSCADRELREAFAPAVLLTFLHRLRAFGQLDPELAPWLGDPFVVGSGASRGERWRRRVAERGWIGALRHALARAVAGPRAGAPTVADGHLLMQLRAVHGFFAAAEAVESRRRSLEEVRRRPDRDLVALFPRLVVPTYPGDDELFASPLFAAALPVGWPVEHATLSDLLDPSLVPEE